MSTPSFKPPSKPERYIPTLPVELWSNIFREATSVILKDEFGADPRAYNEMLCDCPVQSSRITAEELRVALKARLQIILVCRHWRDISLPILYSHFRINVQPGNTTCHALHQTLTADSRLAKYVLRVTVIVEGSSRSRDAVDDTEARQILKMDRGIIAILGLLVNLKVISIGPVSSWSTPQYGQSNTTIADNIERKPCNADQASRPGGWDNLNPGGWGNLLHLTLNFTTSPSFEYHQGGISLPSLVSLDIRMWPTDRNGLVDSIMAQWHTPKLHTFWLYSPEWTRWGPFLNRHASTITILNIRCNPTSIEKTPVHLPNLRELYLEPQTSMQEPGRLVTAPNLQRLVLRLSFPEFVSRTAPILQTKIRLTTLCPTLDAWATTSPVKSYGVLMECSSFDSIMESANMLARIDKLRRRGSRVTFFYEGTLRVFEAIAV